MLAARLWGRHDLRVEEIADPEPPGPGWVLLRVDACGICGTDLEEFTLGPTLVPLVPHPLSGRSAPLTLGHEAVGVVVERGAGAQLDIGTRVAVEGNLFCGECVWCRDHRYPLCEKLAGLGLMADGGLAEYLLAPAYMCLPIDAGVEPDQATLAEPLSVAIRALNRGRIGLGGTVGVVGAGTVGLLVVQAARLAGAARVVAVERIERRRHLALGAGADLAIAPDDDTDAIEDVTGGHGLDVVIEAAGNPAAAARAVRLVRRGGRAVLLGVFDAPVPIDMMDFLLGEKEVVASLSHVYDTDFATAVDLLNGGKIDTGALVTDRIPLSDVVTAGFGRLVAEPEAHLKIVVMPSLAD